MAAQIKLLSTDVLGTLVHTPIDGASSTLNDLIDTGELRRTVHRQTQQLLVQLQQLGVTVVLSSGMSLRSYDRMGPHIPHDYAAIEEGSLLYRNKVEDREWSAKFAKELQVLREYQKNLMDKGLIINIEGRTASFRVDPAKIEVSYHERLTLGMLTRIFPELDAYPPQIRRTIHSPHPPEHACYQFVPASSGKANALEFIMNRLSLGWENVAAFGDDLNDKEMLEKAALPMTLIATHNGDIQKLVIDKKGVIAPGYSHAGSILALSNLVDVVKSQQSGT